MKAVVIALLLVLPVSILADDSIQDDSHHDVPPETLAVLIADQADNRIRLFDPLNTDIHRATLWCYPGEDEKTHHYRPTDAKRVEIDGVVHVLAAYHGRVRLVRFSDRMLIQDYSTLSSCHSAEILPGGAIVSANSNHGILRLHHSEDEFFDLKIPYAHGLAWDKVRNCLWVLGDFLYCINYLEGRLVLDRKFKLPLSPTGHDLFPLREDAALLISNNEALFSFDIKTEKFEMIFALRNIKSASQHLDGSIWVSEPKEIEGAKEWQSNAFISLNSKAGVKRYSRETSRFYKARWWQQVSFSY
ncbi:hypothetical protein CA13_61380 [Planctomycetes bacterium CA13]|uniref:Uncharacterized protein n=1 Tax=Novipirellula herctigrandis TaxID=2527986 RepID=A0A5C5ZBY2_9BACT|nr:hypothetical protein CA13_61380 [Planctomycetes bacterium CA13]